MPSLVAVMNALPPPTDPNWLPPFVLRNVSVPPTKRLLGFVGSTQSALV